MKKEVRIIIVVVLLMFLILILTSCANVPGKRCLTAADCVPATCCHPDDAVNKNYAPDCQDTFCTEECRGGTLDCGQGDVICQNGVCGVKLN